jgi:hypothetical protein
MRYIRPTSLTWWSGVFALSVGVALMVMPTTRPLGELARIIIILAGSSDASPAALIALGLGLIGLRDRLERGFRDGD